MGAVGISAGDEEAELAAFLNIEMNWLLCTNEYMYYLGQLDRELSCYPRCMQLTSRDYFGLPCCTMV